MNKIGDLIARDLSRPIEEVVKLDQQAEQTVREELMEYVATDHIKAQYLDLLRAIADSQGDPSEAVGVWVSGFFGSGKSSFAKNLGHILANRRLLDQPASTIFLNQLQQQAPQDPVVAAIADQLNFINTRLPAHVVMFDVQIDRAVRRATEPIAEIMYTVLLRELDYAQDYDLAALEIELEGEGRLGAFAEACARLYRDQAQSEAEPARELPLTLKGVNPEAYAVWRRLRKGAQKIQRASATLNQLDPKTYPQPDSWAKSLKSSADITIRTLVEHSFELTARRRPGQALVYVVDEVGQYVARSAEKIENLRAVVEHFGQEGKNRVLARKAVAPVWVIVTSQEKLDEVVAAIDDKRVGLAKMQDRFRHRVDMAQSDIREVATRRVLSKKPGAEPVLRELFKQSGGQLRTHIQAERSVKIKFDVTEAEFVQFYPYLPHFIELSIDIVSGMRLQPGAPRHIGGSSRTIIKQAYEMLVSGRTRLAEAPIGRLVTLDRIYDLLEGNLPSERQKDLFDIGRTWPDDPWPARVAKAIALLEYVRGLPRTEKNLAAVLYDALGAPSPLPEVERALARLQEGQFVRATEDGWKLLTVQEKNWTAERNSLSPTTKERNDLWEETLRVIFGDPSLSRFQYRGRTFPLGIAWQSRVITSSKGQIPLELKISDGPDSFEPDGEAVRVQSRKEPQRVFWVLASSDEIDDLAVEVYRSQQMVAKYDQLRAQGKITADESASLAAEKQDALKRQERLKRSVLEALQRGTGFRNGSHFLGPELGKTAGEIIRKLLNEVMPELYPHLEMAARRFESKDAEEVLKAANLSGLPKVFLAGTDGLELVVQDRGKLIINDNAPVAKKVLEYLGREHSYGNKVNGKMLEDYFGDMPFGWEREILWIVLASLLRKGTVEITYQGHRYRNHLDPQVRAVFQTTNAFRSASFAPRKAPDLQALVSAAKRYEELTGEEVDVDEAAIARAFQALASSEREALLPVEAVAKANRIPVLDVLAEYRSTLNSIVHGASDDVVNTLAGEGESFKRLRQQVQEIRGATDDTGLQRLRRARAALERMWPAIAQRVPEAALQAGAETLQRLLESGAYLKAAAQVNEAVTALEVAYRGLYLTRHNERTAAYRAAVDVVRGLPAWAALTEPTEGGLDPYREVRESVLAPLVARACDPLALAEGAVACSRCGATLGEIESDLAALGRLRDDALGRLQQLLKPDEKIERVRVADLVTVYQTLNTEPEVEEFLSRLREVLLKLIESGAKVVLE